MPVSNAMYRPGFRLIKEYLPCLRAGHPSARRLLLKDRAACCRLWPISALCRKAMLLRSFGRNSNSFTRRLCSSESAMVTHNPRFRRTESHEEIGNQNSLARKSRKAKDLRDFRATERLRSTMRFTYEGNRVSASYEGL